jgi:hypothetical protein
MLWWKSPQALLNRGKKQLFSMDMLAENLTLVIDPCNFSGWSPVLDLPCSQMKLLFFQAVC